MNQSLPWDQYMLSLHFGWKDLSVKKIVFLFSLWLPRKWKTDHLRENTDLSSSSILPISHGVDTKGAFGIGPTKVNPQKPEPIAYLQRIAWSPSYCLCSLEGRMHLFYKKIQQSLQLLIASTSTKSYNPRGYHLVYWVHHWGIVLMVSGC